MLVGVDILILILNYKAKMSKEKTSGGGISSII